MKVEFFFLCACLVGCTRTKPYEAPPLSDAPVMVTVRYGDIPESVPAYGIASPERGRRELAVNIEAEDSRKLSVGQRATAYEIPRKSPIECRVSRVLKAASGETGQAIAWLVPVESGAVLHQGEFYFAGITVSTMSHVLSIPREAVLIRDKHTMAVVRGLKEGKEIFEPAAIETGLYSDKAVEVKSGLKIGDEVAVQGGLGFLYPEFKSEAD